uniref:Uncharacterized protein n=1 Tax=Caenorhabditis japonica TaxID=281687 RepID=A0A8R1E4C3_CAEJA
MTMKAEDIVHILRDGIALLPGGRCRAGQAIIVCPSQEQSASPDNLRNVLLYLFEVAADRETEAQTPKKRRTSEVHITFRHPARPSDYKKNT